ncbi:tail completion protein gp17 [Sphingobium sp.]|uniref:tail completion protein gp17 n=1 Tax=Sphingobium sp. TaxID=1912891 RepID=UPI003B3BCA68
MSGEAAARAAVIAALRGDAALMEQANALFDGEPGRAAAPYGFVGEAIGAEWGGKGLDGREVRLTIGLRVGDEATARIAAMMARVDAVMAMLSDQDGWRPGEWQIVTARLIRSRMMRDAPGSPTGWRAIVDYRLRMVRG